MGVQTPLGDGTASRGRGCRSGRSSTISLAGDSLEVFLEDFPSVSREQAVAALEAGYERVLAEAEVVEPAAR